MPKTLGLNLLTSACGTARACTSKRRVRQSASCAGVFAALGLASWMVMPRMSTGDVPSSVDTLNRAHTEIADRIRDAVAASRGVLSVANDAHLPYVELLLWTDDLNGDGLINRSELLLISFSRVLGTISTYRAPGPPSPDGTHPSVRSGGLVDDPIVPFADVHQRTFLDDWRSLPAVTDSVITHGLSDVLLQMTESDAPEHVMIEFGLIWSGDSSDPKHIREVRVNWLAPQSDAKEPVQ